MLNTVSGQRLYYTRSDHKISGLSLLNNNGLKQLTKSLPNDIMT